MRVTEICRLATKDMDTLILEANQGGVKPTDAMMLGTTYHAYILRHNRLSGTPQSIVEIEAENFMTKSAREARQIALDNDLTPMLSSKLREIENDVKKLNFRLDKIFEGAVEYEKEIKAYIDLGIDTEPSLIIGHIDCLTKDKVIDLKVSEVNKDLNKLIFDCGYQLQMYLYMTLANVENAELVFLNPSSLSIKQVSMNYGEIKPECEALLRIASEKQKELMRIIVEEGGVYMTKSEYQTPQWAYQNLLQSEEIK